VALPLTGPVMISGLFLGEPARRDRRRVEHPAAAAGSFAGPVDQRRQHDHIMSPLGGMGRWRIGILESMRRL